LQILSNFANDYGDGIKGRITRIEWAKRAIQSGVITPKRNERSDYNYFFAYVAIHIIDLFF
jgi:1,4-dihydroxy-2-naphthoate octaprenyltransferase